MLARTEDVMIWGGNYPDEGLLHHKTGVNESHSIFTPVVVNGGVLTMVRVPYCRITGLYFLERTPSQNKKGCFLGDGENEFNADTHGLDVYCVKDGPAYGGEDLESYRNIFLDLEKKQKTK